MAINIERTGYAQTVLAAARASDAQPNLAAEQAAAASKTQADRVEISAQGREPIQSEQDFSANLQKKFGYMNMGPTTISGIPTTVTVSSSFLQKCANDPEKAKYLEENLAAIPDCVSYAKSHSLGTLTSASYYIDENGSITGIPSGTNDPDGKIAKENTEKAVRKKREEEKSESSREKVGVNAGKRARMIAAARTPSQVRQVMALLEGDLRDCKAGLERGACDESEVQKVEALIRQAKSRMAQVAGNDEEESPGLSAFDMAALM